MTIGVREIVLAVGWVLSLMAVIFGYRYSLRELKKENNELKSVIFGNQGRLNVIDTHRCKEHRDQIFSAIRKSEKVVEMVLGKLDSLNENVLLISFKMDQANGKKDQKIR